MVMIVLPNYREGEEVNMLQVSRQFVAAQRHRSPCQRLNVGLYAIASEKCPDQLLKASLIMLRCARLTASEDGFVPSDGFAFRVRCGTEYPPNTRRSRNSLAEGRSSPARYFI